MTKLDQKLGPFLQVYELVRQQRKPVLHQQLEELNAEHTKLVNNVLSLPKEAALATKKANERILALEGEIHRVEGELKNIAEDLEQVLVGIIQRRQAIEEVQKKVRGDAAYRRKAEILGQVVERIVCHFRYTSSSIVPKASWTRLRYFLWTAIPFAAFQKRNQAGARLITTRFCGRMKPEWPGRGRRGACSP